MKILAVDSKTHEDQHMDIGCVIPGGHIIKQYNKKQYNINGVQLSWCYRDELNSRSFAISNFEVLRYLLNPHCRMHDFRHSTKASKQLIMTVIRNEETLLVRKQNL